MDITDPEWHALRSEIEQYVELVDSPLELAGRLLNWLRVGNPDVLLERAVARPASQAEATVDPFWAATWRAAIGLDRFFEQLELTDRRVLELGCGSGQAGTAAAIRGAQVTSTDSVDLALKVAQLNSWEYRNRIQFKSLLWGMESLNERFPILIGSDLVYDPKLYPELNQCAQEHLEESGRMYLSEPQRHTGDIFSRWIIEAGWTTQEHLLDLGDERIPVRIFECWRP